MERWGLKVTVGEKERLLKSACGVSVFEVLGMVVLGILEAEKRFIQHGGGEKEQQ